MAEFLKVDPVAVAQGSNHLETSVTDLTMDFIIHEDGLADAAPGWIGESAHALTEVMQRWEAKHAQDPHRRPGSPHGHSGNGLHHHRETQRTGTPLD